MLAQMPSFVVECYVPQHPNAVAAGLAGARRAAELSSGVSYLRTTHIPGDETCFHVFDAPSSSALSEAARLAALDHMRIVEAVETTAPSGKERKSQQEEGRKCELD
jgi:hypothetical protein